LLVVAPRPGRRPEPDAVLDLLAAQFPKWMLPERVVFVDELPHTATGKIMKTQLREMFAGRSGD
jgi:fatty-acyl-CoA synthase